MFSCFSTFPIRRKEEALRVMNLLTKRRGNYKKYSHTYSKGKIEDKSGEK
jgi:hypothetical protein